MGKPVKKKKSCGDGIAGQTNNVDKGAKKKRGGGNSNWGNHQKKTYPGTNGEKGILDKKSGKDNRPNKRGPIDKGAITHYDKVRKQNKFSGGGGGGH